MYELLYLFEKQGFGVDRYFWTMARSQIFTNLSVSARWKLGLSGLRQCSPVKVTVLGLLYDRSGQQSVRELADKLTQLLYFSAIVFRLYGRLAARFLPSPRSCDRDGSKSSYSYPTFGTVNYAS